MIRGAYNVQINPPAPFVLITLTDPLVGDRQVNLPAQIDTAADRTVVPLSAMESLGLEPIDEIVICGFGGTLQRVPLYLVTFTLHTYQSVVVRVLAHPDEPWVLLGRDILNGYRLLLDGPNLILEIG